MSFVRQPDAGRTRMAGAKMKPSKTNIRVILAGLLIVAAGLLGFPRLVYGQAAQRQQIRGEDFFIISSVDAKKQQLVLKLPTEVTEVVRVTSETTYRDQSGKALKFEDLRAGDTVYAKIARNSAGALTLVSLRRAPMTLEELHRRYFREE